MFNSFLYVLNLFYSKNKKSLVLFLICTIIEIPLLLDELFYTKHFVDTIENSIEIFRSDVILFNMTILVIILFTSGILSSFIALCRTNIEEISLYEKDLSIIEKTLTLSLLDLDSSTTKTLREKAMKVKLHTLLEEWIFLFSDFFKILLLMSILLYYNLFYLLMLIICLISLQLFGNNYVATKIKRISQSQTSLKIFIDYVFGLLIDRDTIQEITILKVKEYLKTKLANLSEVNISEMQKIIFNTEIIKATLNLFFSIVNIIVIILLVLATTKDINTSGMFILLYQIANNLFALISSLTSHYHNLTQEILKYKDFYSYLQKKEQHLNTYSSSISNKGLSIEIRNLHFSYDHSNIKALNGVTLNIKPGEKVAFVGHNGSGKSTLIKIIMGLYSPSQGNINWLTDGLPIPNNAVPSKTRVVFQDYAKLLRPLRENIALGNIEKLHNDSHLLCSLRKAHANKYTQDLNQLMGPEFGGLDISGGQWQKIAIARAYSNEGELLIYDEATSSLDPYAELEAFKSFLSLAHGKTSIIVTHRLSMTRFVDKIVLIENGRITEYGTHEELIKQNGQYAIMYSAQSCMY